MNYQMIKNCRVCGSTSLQPIIHLGDQPLANSLLKSQSEQAEVYPLSISFCNHCSLVQLNETIDKEKLFKEYVWVTGTSSTAREYAQTFYERAVKTADIKENDFVVEIASNDGTFLKKFVENKFNALGVEPAENIAKMAQDAGVNTLSKFWSKETAKEVRDQNGAAKLVFARNVVPHVSELHSVIEGFSEVLADDGTGVIEFHYAGTILDELHYDSIYHEHLCYFSIKAMEYLLKNYRLQPFHMDKSPISGGSYVIYFSKNARPITDAYQALVEEENKIGLTELSAWKKFAERCEKHKFKSKEVLELANGKSVVAFGASARSSTYANYCDFSTKDIVAVIDNNELKQGLFTAGTNIPIVSMDEGFAKNPDVIFIIAWNFKDEIIRLCREKGFQGKFVVPFPGDPELI